MISSAPAPNVTLSRRYLEGLLLPAARNKTLTALANTEPVAGAQRKEAQSMQGSSRNRGGIRRRLTSAGWSSCSKRARALQTRRVSW